PAFPQYYDICNESLIEFDCLIDARVCNRTERDRMSSSDINSVMRKSEKFKMNFKSFCDEFDRRTRKIELLFKREFEIANEAFEALQGLVNHRQKRDFGATAIATLVLL